MGSYEQMDYRKYTIISESDKAINTLKGILIGINMNKEVNNIELKELNNWCDINSNLINRNPFKELVLLIKEANVDAQNRHESLLDLLWLCERYGDNSIYYNYATAELQILQGICHGIIADGKIEDTEIFNLNRWMKEHEHLMGYFPFDEIRSLLLAILSDGRIDDEERKRLLAYFNAYSKIATPEISSQIKTLISNINLSAICTADPDVKFENKTFCFTGIAKRASRVELKDKVESLGGTFSDNLTKNTDFLIVGDNGNVCWAFACYGRKVEKAFNMRLNGSKISIVHEFDFWDFVDDMRN